MLICIDHTYTHTLASVHTCTHTHIHPHSYKHTHTDIHTLYTKVVVFSTIQTMIYLKILTCTVSFIKS